MNEWLRMTGREMIKEEELLLQSARVYNFQRVFNLRMGFGTRKLLERGHWRQGR